MIRWFGRGFRTYLPSKRAKYGMKAYKVCVGSGYTYDSSYTPEGLVRCQIVRSTVSK